MLADVETRRTDAAKSINVTVADSDATLYVTVRTATGNRSRMSVLYHVDCMGMKPVQVLLWLIQSVALNRVLGRCS